MINYIKIQETVEAYLKETSRSKRNSLFMLLIDAYEPVIKTKLNGVCLESQEDLKQTIALELCKALFEYDVTKAKFNTFFYYRMLDLKKRFFRATNTTFLDKKNHVGTWNHTEDELDHDYLLMDLKLDISKVLTPEEILIFKKSFDKKIKNVDGRIDNIINKILTY